MNNCRLELEDRNFLQALPTIPVAFHAFARPAKVTVEWHKTENQGRMGSCQGNDLTSVLERLQQVARKPVTQLSRIFAYLATQRIDGLLGRDQGSTISGGAKLALEFGVPPEAKTGYPPSYPSRDLINALLSQANYEAGALFKALSRWAVPEDPEDAKNWIGGGGGISLGIAWPGVPHDRVIRSFRGGNGGHAIAILGYDDAALTAVNSHGDGPFQITNDAWRQMIRHSYTAAIGLAGSTEPAPVDWANESYFV